MTASLQWAIRYFCIVRDQQTDTDRQKVMAIEYSGTDNNNLFLDHIVYFWASELFECHVLQNDRRRRGVAVQETRRWRSVRLHKILCETQFSLHTASVHWVFIVRTSVPCVGLHKALLEFIA